MFPVGLVLISDLVSWGLGVVLVVRDGREVVGEKLEEQGCRYKKETNLCCGYLDGILRRSQWKP
jgi:hypothetical protein